MIFIICSARGNSNFIAFITSINNSSDCYPPAAIAGVVVNIMDKRWVYAYVYHPNFHTSSTRQAPVLLLSQYYLLSFLLEHRITSCWLGRSDNLAGPFFPAARKNPARIVRNSLTSNRIGAKLTENSTKKLYSKKNQTIFQNPAINPPYPL